MSLLSVVQDVCAVVGVTRPTTVVGGLAGNRTMQEMFALATEMAQRIAYDARDWQLLTATTVYAGDGVTEAFPLPANYQRMLLNGNVWRSTSNVIPMRFVDDPDDWLRRRIGGYYDTQGEWAIIGGKIHFVPILAAPVYSIHDPPPMGTPITPAQTVRFSYLTNECIQDTATTFATAFANDSDQFRLGDRLLKLGMIWQWKAQKGSPYAEDMSTYEIALGNVSGRDRPSPILVQTQPISRYARVAYPYPLPTS